MNRLSTEIYGSELNKEILNSICKNIAGFINCLTIKSAIKRVVATLKQQPLFTYTYYLLISFKVNCSGILCIALRKGWFRRSLILLP